VETGEKPWNIKKIYPQEGDVLLHSFLMPMWRKLYIHNGFSTSPQIVDDLVIVCIDICCDVFYHF
jgi:hypothetical protein